MKKREEKTLEVEGKKTRQQEEREVAKEKIREGRKPQKRSKDRNSRTEKVCAYAFSIQ